MPAESCLNAGNLKVVPPKMTATLVVDMLSVSAVLSLQTFYTLLLEITYGLGLRG